ncbi:MAG: tetratricopeptide repeat protein [Planctomycetota bacterium]
MTLRLAVLAGAAAHFVLCTPMVAIEAGNPDASAPIAVRDAQFDLTYSVNEKALPLEGVQLFYTLDRGTTWLPYGLDEDRQSPISFQAATEGLHGFYFLVSNSSGNSGSPPVGSEVAHLWALVDYSPPVVQLHELLETTSLSQRVLQIRWTAVDALLTPRPIDILYQKAPDPTWRAVCPDSLANTGRYDWRLPEDITGLVSVRIMASDQGGHNSESNVRTADLPHAVSLQPRGTTSKSAPPGPGIPNSGKPTQDPAPKSKERAARLVSEAIGLRDVGLDREAMGRFRESIKLNPQQPQTFAEMGDLLFRLGDADRALDAYGTALAQQPNLVQALRGSALVFQQRKDYGAAAEKLRAVLLMNPKDAATWLRLGDLAVFQGDELLARECYTRATQTDPSATEIITEAHRRSSAMKDASRVYRPPGGP